VEVPVGTTLEEAGRMIILQTLASAGGNKSRAAKILGISRKALYDRLRSYGGPA
jgi:DNA-binding NtrC family response regulator